MRSQRPLLQLPLRPYSSLQDHVHTRMAQHPRPAGCPAQRSGRRDRAATESVPVSRTQYSAAQQGAQHSFSPQYMPCARSTAAETQLSGLSRRTQVRQQAQLALSSRQIFPNKSRPTEVKERCTLTGRGRGVLSKGLPYGLCRVSAQRQYRGRNRASLACDGNLCNPGRSISAARRAGLAGFIGS